MNNNYFFSFFPPHEILFADSYLVAWKRGIAILSAGTVKVTPDPRVRLVNGYSLQIKDAVPQDAGDYVCQIATMEPREITHTVEILGKFFSPPDFLYRLNVKRLLYEMRQRRYGTRSALLFCFHFFVVVVVIQMSWNLGMSDAYFVFIALCQNGGPLNECVCACERFVRAFDNEYDDVNGNDFTILHKSAYVLSAFVRRTYGTHSAAQ